MNLDKTIEIGKNINTSAAHIYTILCNMEGTILKAEAMAELIGMNTRSFRRNISSLREAGYIRTELIGHDGCIYHIVN